jgi:DNA replication and repair protein RecF
MSFIKKLVLNNFRNYTLKSIDLSEGLNLIVGPNAIGKTSIIEAINMLSTGDSFRAGKIEEMVKFDQELGRIQGKIIAGQGADKDQDEDKLEVVVTRGMVQGKRTQHRIFSLNDAKKRKKDFVGQFYSVVFRPEDMRLIEGSKGRRRSFMDEALKTLDWEYALSLKKYEEALRKRNKLLTQIREKEMPPQTLKYWDMMILKYGQYLQKQRSKLLGSFKNVEFPLEFEVEYVPSVISEQRLKQYQSREIMSGHTLVGPHKDDLVVRLRVPGKDEDGNPRKVNIATYGSRGQQRMGVLWLKLCQLNFVENATQQKVVLLLDDILSELDPEMVQHVLDLMDGRQTVVTSADGEVEGVFKDLEMGLLFLH